MRRPRSLPIQAASPRSDLHHIGRGSQELLDAGDRHLSPVVGTRMSQPHASRFNILGRGWGSQRVHLCASDEQEAETKAKQVAAMPGQAPVMVIDTAHDPNSKPVKFFFADGEVVSVVRIRYATASHVAAAVHQRHLGSVDRQRGKLKR
jgi:hypothetical protein